MDITRICLTCDGTGVVPHGENDTVPCYSCKGAGTDSGGNIANGSKTLDERLTDVETALTNIMSKCNDIYDFLSS